MTKSASSLDPSAAVIFQRPLSNSQRVISLPVLNRRVDFVAARHVFEVGLNFRSRREAMAPLRIQGEGVAVEMGGHVAGDAGVGILAPRPAGRSAFS